MVKAVVLAGIAGYFTSFLHSESYTCRLICFLLICLYRPLLLVRNWVVRTDFIGCCDVYVVAWAVGVVVSSVWARTEQSSRQQKQATAFSAAAYLAAGLVLPLNSW